MYVLCRHITLDNKDRLVVYSHIDYQHRMTRMPPYNEYVTNLKVR